MIAKDVLGSEEHAYQDDDSAEKEYEEMCKVQLNHRFVFNNSHNRRLGCNGDIRRI